MMTRRRRDEGVTTGANRSSYAISAATAASSRGAVDSPSGSAAARGAGSSAWASRSVTVGGPSADSSRGGSKLSARAGGASDTACATPSNTVLQCPQRTCPARSASCSGLTRNTVAQPGQRVYFSSGMECRYAVGAARDDGRSGTNSADSAGACATAARPRQRDPAIVALADADIKPTPIHADQRTSLSFEDSREHDTPAGPDARCERRCKNLQRVCQNVGDHDVESPWLFGCKTLRRHKG